MAKTIIIILAAIISAPVTIPLRIKYMLSCGRRKRQLKEIEKLKRELQLEKEKLGLDRILKK